MRVLEEEKRQLLTLIDKHKGAVEISISPPNRASVSQNSFLQLDKKVGLNSRSQSFANNMILKLKRRCSSASRHGISFHKNSQANNLSIYPVTEDSNESPDIKSSEQDHFSEDKRRQIGEASTSIYFHANNLSVW